MKNSMKKAGGISLESRIPAHSKGPSVLHHFHRNVLAASIMVASSLSGSAFAQSSGGMLGLEEIVVTARRRDEGIQDVPLTVNAVSSDTIEDLNIRKLEDLQGVVAGLTLEEATIAPNASLRGVRFDTFISGNSPSVEFYMNDAPISITAAMQALFDVGQIEVLRGPQGTLRGRASPSGAITIVTQRPELDNFGGYIDVTGSDQGHNVKGALNIPIIEDMLALRLAGFQEKNDQDGVKSLNDGNSADYDGKGYRASLLFEPMEELSFNLMYQKVEPTRTQYAMVESAHLADPSLTPPAGHRTIQAKDRLSVLDVPTEQPAEFERLNLEIAWEIAGQQLNYAGHSNEMDLTRFDATDTGDVFSSAFPEPLQAFGQYAGTTSDNESHELRLSSVEPLFGFVDYVVGVLDQENKSTTPLINRTAVFFGFLNPATFVTVAETPILVDGGVDERSYFGNLTFHIGDDTEFSAGMRDLQIDRWDSLSVNGREILPDFAQSSKNGDTISSFSLKHDFSEDLMAYASYGESFRIGGTATGDFSLFQTDREVEFSYLDPETSESIELGIKSSWLNDRLKVNATIYNQEFDNYPYRSAGGGVNYANFTFGGFDPNTGIILVPVLGQHNFGAAVPVEVNGIEIETNFQATEQLNMGLLYSYSKGEIKNGTIPCNDYLPFDGVADAPGVIPTVEDILATGDHVGACSGVTQRANATPLWTATLTSEYTFEVAGMGAYVRGLWTLYGESKNDPTNTVDDVDAYNTLNLYAGVKDPKGTWEVKVYGKNITDTEEVISRDAEPLSQSYQVLDQSFNATGSSTSSGYRQVKLTAPREFGINLRYNF